MTNADDNSVMPTPRTAMLHKLYNPKNGELLDVGLVLWFPGVYSGKGW